MKRDRGFVLVNALVLVAAMAAAAIFVLAQAETSRARLVATRDADQLVANLDAFEALAMLRIMRDDPSVDHMTEDWATPATSFELDRGTVSGTLADLEGRFNINWLAGSQSVGMRQVFARLLEHIGARAGIADDVYAALAPARSDTDTPSGYALLDPPLDPVGGALFMMRQLEDIPALSDRDLARIKPFVAVLPGDSRLNVNTAPAEVITAFFPNGARQKVEAVLATRATTPITAPDSFLEAIALELGPAFPTTLDKARFAVASTWFEATATARLHNRTAQRVTVFERQGTARRPRIHWHISQHR